MTLSERIEAEGPSRALEVAIADAIWLAKWGKKRPKDIAVEPFTTSLDAAMTLVPEGLEWELYGFDAARDPRFGRFQARILMLSYADDPEELGPQATCDGATPAAALAAAALKARGL